MKIEKEGKYSHLSFLKRGVDISSPGAGLALAIGWCPYGKIGSRQCAIKPFLGFDDAKNSDTTHGLSCPELREVWVPLSLGDHLLQLFITQEPPQAFFSGLFGHG